MEWCTACPDWEARILARQSLIPFAPLFPAEADAALEVFKALKIVDAPGSPEMGVAARDWVFDFVAAIFGAYDQESGRRLINEFFLLISKKNAKSTTAAGIMLTALLLNWRKSAEFIILAPTLEIAKNSSEPAMDMVNEDPELRRLLKPIAHQRRIEHLDTGAALSIVAADSDTVGGKKASGVLIDELWLFGKRANAENMLREATGGLASRPEGFTIALSTQSDEPPAGVFKDWLHRFRDIRDGKTVAPRSLGVLYEYPPDMVERKAYEKPENFYVTNPNIGVSVDEQFLLDEQSKAHQVGAKSLPGFYAKHLNVEVGLSLRSDRWSGADHWESAADPSLKSLDDLIDRCDVITLGLDGGGLDDLLGATALGREKTTRRLLSWSHAWAHKVALERRKDIASVLLGFEKQGHLTLVESPNQDINEVADIAEQLYLSGLLPEKNAIGVDPVGIGQIVDEIVARDVPQELIIGISQGYKLTGAIKTAERGLKDKTILHASQAMMNWCVGNAKVEPRGNAIIITKQAAGGMKIDPLMAFFNAVALMSMNPEARRSTYEDKPLLIL